jgi:tetratricopeptide (TPR) repeat protein
VIIGGVAIVIGVGATLDGGQRASEPTFGVQAPFRQDEEDEMVVEHVPGGAVDPLEGEVLSLRERLDREPRDLQMAVRLARLHIDLSRRRSDPRHLGYAQAALGPWWDETVPRPQVLLLRATILQSRHQFNAALADLDRLVAVDPTNPQAWLTRAVVLTVQARYDEALKSCAAPALAALSFVAAACRAPIDGRADTLLGKANTVSETAWGHSIAGEIAAWSGDAVAARRHLVEALRVDPADIYTRAAYADLLLDESRPDEVLPLLDGYQHDDGLLLRLALASRALGSPQATALTQRVADRFATNRRRGDDTHQREEARFVLALASDPERALALATANWQVQKEPWDARLLLEAARAAGRPEVARPVLTWLRSAAMTLPHLRRLADGLRETD